MTQPIERGIDLTGIPRTNKTAAWLDVAARTGSKKILSMNDVLSYGVYSTRFQKCGTDYRCQRGMSRWDGEQLRNRWYTPKTVRSLLEQFSGKETFTIILGASMIMNRASRLIKSLRPATTI